MYKKGGIVYRTYSIVQSILFFIFRIGYLTGVAIALFHFNDNPVIMTIIVIICGVFFLVTTMDEIIVYQNSIKFSNGLIFKKFRLNKLYKISEIESITISGDYRTADELYSKPISWQDKPFNKVEIKLKTGTSEIFSTSIYINKLRKVIEETNKLKYLAK